MHGGQLCKNRPTLLRLRVLPSPQDVTSSTFKMVFSHNKIFNIFVLCMKKLMYPFELFVMSDTLQCMGIDCPVMASVMLLFDIMILYPSNNNNIPNIYLGVLLFMNCCIQLHHPQHNIRKIHLMQQFSTMVEFYSYSNE